MNKSVRFLIVFIIMAAMFALIWRKDSQGRFAMVSDESRKNMAQPLNTS